MPEYVYALHDFLPENDDEVTFRAGERIEIVEKDDLYGDGWWQGRNLAGHVGLFPQSYTAPAPPESDGLGLAISSSSSTPPPQLDDSKSKPPSKSTPEESITDSLTNSNSNIVAPKPQVPAVFLNGNEPSNLDENPQRTRTTSGDGEVMKATMTDVQKAIEQLGRGRGVTADDRSFSFASSVGDQTDRETDTDMSDADGPNDESWHKDARAKLAAKAKKAVEEAEKFEAMFGSNSRRAAAPPIEAELSDESEPEDGEFTMHHSRMLDRSQSIPEEDEDEETDQEIMRRIRQQSLSSNNTNEPSSGPDSTLVDVPPRDESDAPTATKSTFPYSNVSNLFTPPESKTPAPTSPPVENEEARATPVAVLPAPKPRSPSPTQTETRLASAPIRESMIALPSPTGGSFNGTPNEGIVPASPPPRPDHSKYISVMSNYSVASTISEPPPVPSFNPAAQNAGKGEEKEKSKTHPSDWTVDEVVDWLQSKGFDKDVCDKFTEQEITGDVLLELDVNLLKTEIGIMAFGKRMRIANAITDLRRPPSVIYPDTPDQLSPVAPPMGHTSLTQSQSHSMSHSRSVSQSQSHHSFPGTYSYTQSVRSSLGSPMYGSSGFPSTVQESPATEYTEAPSTERGLSEYGMSPSIAPSSPNGKPLKIRPAQLTLSPSDSALKSSAQAVSDIPEEPEEDIRGGHMSDGDVVPKSMRHRIFRRSVDSRTDSIGNSRHSSVIGPPTPDKEPKDKERTARHKKSVDGKTGERLSIFGGSLGGLGKARKPAPKYPSGSDELGSHDRSSIFGRHSTRKSSGPATGRENGNGAIAEKENGRMRDSAPAAPTKDTQEKEQREATVLRKRTASTPASPPPAPTDPNTIVSPLKPGQSILEQIGEPDHSGWMRKRGERYNSWKLRFFVLKGQHLYCLKSNSTSETKIKGYVNIVGYKVTVDENLNPGKYGFRIEHDNDKTHFFSSDEKMVVRDWMKAIMKATIGRDYSKPVISSVNIPTIPLVVAQTMNPGPRPPSPGARDATQRALRRENPNQLSSRDARVLMGLPGVDNSKEERRQSIDTYFNGPQQDVTKSPVPPRPSRESRRTSMSRTISVASTVDDKALIDWANSHLPGSHQISETSSTPCGGLELLRIAESIKGRPASPPVADSEFPKGPTDDKIEGLFRLFDFLLDNDVKMGSISINDIRQGKRDKIIQLLKALKAWEDKRRAIVQSLGGASSVQAAGFMAPVWS